MTATVAPLLVDEAIWVLTEATGISAYDFDFRAFLPCRVPWSRPEEITVVSRRGAISDYEALASSRLRQGMRLVNSPAEHRRASALEGWYPLVTDLTPRSVVYDTVPTSARVAEDIGFPVFVKGARQTSRHTRSLSVARTPDAFEELAIRYRRDAILGWQPMVVRELVGLRLVEDTGLDRLPSCFEFRTFWWKGNLVGAGRYWHEGRSYNWTAGERDEALAVGERAARRLGVPFVVIDLAMTEAGEWIVIEANDAQESGYAGVSPLALWQGVISLEKP